MVVLFEVLGIFFFLGGLWVFGNMKSVLDMTAAFLLLIVAAIFICGAAIVEALSRVRGEIAMMRAEAGIQKRD